MQSTEMPPAPRGCTLRCVVFSHCPGAMTRSNLLLQLRLGLILQSLIKMELQGLRNNHLKPSVSN